MKIKTLMLWILMTGFSHISHGQICLEEFDKQIEAVANSEREHTKLLELTIDYNQQIYGEQTPEQMYADLQALQLKWMTGLREKFKLIHEYNNCVSLETLRNSKPPVDVRKPRYFQNFSKTLTIAGAGCTYVRDQAVAAIQFEQAGQFDGCVLATESMTKNYERIQWWGALEKEVSCTATALARCYRY